MAANTTISAGTSSEGIQVKDGDDSLQVQSSNHRGMVLVTSPLNCRNFSAWSREVKIALGAKLKLGFITGECKKPAVDSEHYKQWVRIDFTVTSWLLNSITKNITDAFLYAKSARELWVELEERFEKNNMGLNEVQDAMALFTKELNEQKKKNANGGKAFLAQTNGAKKAHRDAKMDEVASVSEVLMEVMRLMKSRTHPIKDQMSIEVVGVARQIGKLYVLENNSFSSQFIDQFSSEPFSLVSQVAHVDVMLWHKDWDTRPIKFSIIYLT
ncbi:UNVERIFIED_CONTAM: hypothetical protein Scaly_1782500 [Sesamum calycinum]|uniref:Retrotransposon Copia-like N-terminal domain-containing protein n=1 Tax=Sesamum calycinum TaxID=2727403 RepID=A0AAW2NXJ0_9LAMI